MVISDVLSHLISNSIALYWEKLMAVPTYHGFPFRQRYVVQGVSDELLKSTVIKAAPGGLPLPPSNACVPDPHSWPRLPPGSVSKVLMVRSAVCAKDWPAPASSSAAAANPQYFDVRLYFILLGF